MATYFPMDNVIPIRSNEPAPPKLTEERAVALALCAAHMINERLRSLKARFPPGIVEAQIVLADSKADQALIGTMAGRAGRAIWNELGITEDGSPAPPRVSPENVEEARQVVAAFWAYENTEAAWEALRRVADLLGVPR